MITGAGRGIGLAQANYCAGLGANVVIVDSGAEMDGTGSDALLAPKVARDIGRQGGVAFPCALDVRAEGACAEVIDLCVRRFEKIDAIVLNAGIHTETPLRHMHSEHLRTSLEYIQAAYTWTTHAIDHWWDSNQSGALLLTTSSRAWYGQAHQAHLSTIDASIVALVKSAALELRHKPIRINAIAPCALSRQTEHTPEFRRVGMDAMSPEHIAPVAAFLISPLAKDIHGEVLAVTGHRIYSFQTLQTPGVFTTHGISELSDLEPLVQKALRSS